MPLRTEQSIYQGETKILLVSLVDTDGAAVDITDATIKYRAGDISKATGGNGIAITDGPGGQFELTLSPEDTIDHRVGVYSHECKVKLSSGAVHVVFVGTLRIARTLITAI